MPDYVTRPFDPSFPVPASLREGVALALVTQGTWSNLQALLDGWLNAADGSPYRFMALSSFVAVALDTGRLAVDPGAQTNPARGQVPHQELAVAFAVLPWQQIEGGWQVCLPRWVMPFLSVSTAEAMVTGREVLGWDKTVGDFFFDRTGAIDFSAFTASTRTWASPSPTELGRVAPVIEGRRDPAATPRDDLDLVDELAKQIAAGMPGGGHIPHPDIPASSFSVAPEAAGIVTLDGDDRAAGVDTKKWLRLPAQTVVNLKQFRDAADPTQACFMSLLDSPVGLAITGLPRIWVNDWTLSFTDYSSHPWTSWLGVQASSTAPLAFSTKVLMNIDAGSPSWTAAPT